MMDSNSNRQHGFGLIEVMVALVMLAVTAGSLLQLSKYYLNYERESASREIALRLIESKLDTFKHSRTLDEYQAISSGSEQQTVAGRTFDLLWEVSEWAWDKDSQQWFQGGVDPAFTKKDIQLNIKWQDGHPEPQQLFLQSSVTFLTPIMHGPFGWSGVAGAAPPLAPQVAYSPHAEPSVVPFLLAGDEYKESSPPLISVDTNNVPLSVKIDSIVYSHTQHKRQQQRFITLACDCKLAGAVAAKLPAQIELNQGLSYWQAGDEVVKPSGMAVAGQPALCTVCCADHFDGLETHFEHWHNAKQWQQTQMTHHHFDNLQQPVSQLGSRYQEACRLIRRAGAFEVANDWQLVELTIMSADFLAQHLAAYQAYIEQRVVTHLHMQIQAPPNDYSDGDPLSFADYLADLGVESALVLTASDVQPLIARGLYIDLLAPKWRQFLASTVLNNAATAPLTATQRAQLFKLAPMTEVDLTPLVDWQSLAPDIVSFAAPAELTAHQSGLAQVVAVIRRNNSGLVGAALGPLDEANTFDAELAVRVE